MSFRLTFLASVALLTATACSSTPTDETSSNQPASGGAGSKRNSGGGSGTGGTAGTLSGACGIDDVRTLFRTRCADSVCHDAAGPAAGLDLTVADPAAALVGVASSLCPEETLVVEADPDASLLVDKLTSPSPRCGAPMPVGSALEATDIECVRSWVASLGTAAADCERCGGELCVDFSRDRENCGSCGNACDPGAACDQGTCFACDAGLEACGSACVDLSNDASHCGACGSACGIGEVCSEGSCTCAGASVSFAADVAPILDANCTAAGCHSGRLPQEGLELAASVSYRELVGQPSSQCSDGRERVVPGDPAASYLISKLTGVDMCYGTLMPKRGQNLSAEDLATISAWICAGAADD